VASTSIDDDADDTDAEISLDTPARKKRLPLIAGAAAALLAVSGGAYYMLGNRSAAHEEAPAADLEKALVDVPEMTISLHTSDGRPHLLKLHFMLVAANPKAIEGMRAKLPLYIDALQPFLHELRPEDLNGSAAIFRVKEEMLSRASGVFGDAAVKDILVQDLIQL